MPRYRVEFAKEEPLRFISHLDMVKAFERATRRAGLPVAFSQGFNPHPKINFAVPVPVGVISAREYVDIELREAWPLEKIRQALVEALPPGFGQVEVRNVPGNAPPLMAVLNRAAYRVRAQVVSTYTQEDLDRAVATLLARPVIEVQRKTKKGARTVNLRPGIFRLAGRLREGEIIVFDLLLLIGPTGNVRPEEVLAVLQGEFAVPIDMTSLEIYRSGLFISQGENLISPWDA